MSVEAYWLSQRLPLSYGGCTSGRITAISKVGTIMFVKLSVLFAQLAEKNLGDAEGTMWFLIGGAVVIAIGLVLLLVVLTYGKIWFQAYMSNARVSIMSLIGMSFRQVNVRVIVQSRIMARQAGVGNDPTEPITTRRLEAHYLAGGDVPRVVRAIIARIVPISISTLIGRPRSIWPAAMCSTRSRPA